MDARRLAATANVRSSAAPPPSCQVFVDRDRNVDQIYNDWFLPGQTNPSFVGSMFGRADPTTLDTEDLATSWGPLAKVIAAFGEYRLRQQAVIDTTSCYILPDRSEIASIDFFSVNCLPIWEMWDADNIRRLSLDGPIILNADSALANAAAAAGSAWQQALGQAGLSATFVPGTCAISDPHCIFLTQAPHPTRPTACAGLIVNGVTPTTGVISASTNIYVPNRSYTDEEKVRLIIHELGHLLGLEDRGCYAHSIMWTPEILQSEDCHFLPSQAATTPTPNDTLPIAKTVYGLGARSVCPTQ